MLTRPATRLLSTQTRAFSISSADEICCTWRGRISLLLKVDPLNIYDIRGATGVAADVSYIITESSVCYLVLASLIHINLALSLTGARRIID